MIELLSIKDFPHEAKIALLNELGYDSDGLFVTDSNGEKVRDRYTNEEIKVENMIILPGSTIVLDNNPLSVASYIEEFGDVF